MTHALLSRAGGSPARASSRAPQTVRRAEHDFYPTPPEAVRALLSVESFDAKIWEPACGDGAISKELIRHGREVYSTDLIDRGYGRGGEDFLSPFAIARTMLEQPGIRHVVTNPPYSYQRGVGDKFVGQALRVARQTGGKIAMLLNLGCLAHPMRTQKWRNSPPAAIHIMDDLTFWPNGDYRQAGRFITEHRYCWVVWRPDHSGPTIVTWLRMAEFRQQGGAA